MSKHLLIVVALFSLPELGFAANYYVRSDATGLNNGSDWANAYTQLPANLVRGGIYYVADGSYGGYVFDDAPSGSTYIEVRKATASDHGTSTGWLSAYGDGVAYWGALTFKTSYYLLDGIRGFGRDVEQYGFQQDFSSRSTPIKALIVEGDYIILRHLKSFWDNRDDTSEAPSRWLDATAGSPNNITVSFCYIKELPGLPFYFINSFAVLVEYLVMEGMHSDSTWHAEIASNRSLSDLTVRYSWFMDANGTGGWMSMEGQNANWRIYGNVFEQTNKPHTNPGFGHGIFADNMQTGSSTSGVFYNNTIANYTATIRSGLSFWAATSPIESRNNIARNSVGFGNMGVDVASHNYLSSCPSESEFNVGIESSLQRDSLDPFVDSTRDNDGALQDWQLSGTNLPAAGYALPAPYNESCLNRLWQGPSAICVARGADGRWDRGAIELAGGGSSQPLGTPQNLRVISN